MARSVHILRPRQRHAHAALGEALGFAEQAQVGAGHAQGFVHTVEGDALGFNAAVNDSAGARVAQPRLPDPQVVAIKLCNRLRSRL